MGVPIGFARLTVEVVLEGHQVPAGAPVDVMEWAGSTGTAVIRYEGHQDRVATTVLTSEAEYWEGQA